MRSIKFSSPVKFWGLAIILMTVTLISRFYLINSIPANLQPDAIDNLRTFMAWHKYGSIKTIFTVNWNGAPSLNANLIGWSWRLAGQSFGGVRLAAIFFSSIAVLLTYFYIYLMTQKRLLAFIFSLLLATNVTFLYFSRSGWENIFTSTSVLLALIGLYFVKKTHFKKGLIYMSLASISGFYFYHPGKLIFPSLLLLLLMTKIKLRIKLALLMALSLMTLFFISPQLLFSLSNRGWINSTGRINNVSIFNQSAKNTAWPTKLLHNSRAFLFFASKDFHIGLNERYAPLAYQDYLIQPLVVLLYLIGLTVGLKRHQLIGLFYFINLAIIQLFSLNTPNIARFIHLLPLVYIFAALGLDFFITYMESAEHHFASFNQWAKRKRLDKVALISVLLLVSFMVQRNITTYFVWANSTECLATRQPAISFDEYERWLQFTKKHISQTGSSLNVYQWHALDSASTQR